VDLVTPRSELRSTISRLLRLLPVAPVEEPGREDQHAWGPIGVLSGLAERVGGAVSETIGIKVEPEATGPSNGDRPTRSPSEAEPTPAEDER